MGGHGRNNRITGTEMCQWARGGQQTEGAAGSGGVERGSGGPVSGRQLRRVPRHSRHVRWGAGTPLRSRRAPRARMHTPRVSGGQHWQHSLSSLAASSTAVFPRSAGWPLEEVRRGVAEGTESLPLRGTRVEGGRGGGEGTRPVHSEGVDKKFWHDQRALSSKRSSHPNAGDSGGILARQSCVPPPPLR